MSPQDLIFACIEEASFNGFDGPRIVKGLRDNAHLWEAVIASDGASGAFTLRDLPVELHVDSLYVRSSGKDDAALEELMRSLGADEVDWVECLGKYEGYARFRNIVRDRRVLRAWWD